MFIILILLLLFFFLLALFLFSVLILLFFKNLFVFGKNLRKISSNGWFQKKLLTDLTSARTLKVCCTDFHHNYRLWQYVLLPLFIKFSWYIYIIRKKKKYYINIKSYIFHLLEFWDKCFGKKKKKKHKSISSTTSQTIITPSPTPQQTWK